MMQIVAPIWKIKLREAAEIIRERRKKTRLNTQCTRKIGHFLSTNLESENTDSLGRSTRIRGWWSSAAWLENQVVRLGVGCTWAQQMVLSVECWKTDERVNSLRLALGSSVRCQEWDRTLPETQKICRGKIFLNQCVTELNARKKASNFKKVSVHSVFISRFVILIWELLSKWFDFAVSFYLPDIFTCACILIRSYALLYPSPLFTMLSPAHSYSQISPQRCHLY